MALSRLLPLLALASSFLSADASRLRPSRRLSLQSSVGTTGTVLIIVIVAVVALALGAFLARKCLRSPKSSSSKSPTDDDAFPSSYDPDNLMRLVGLDGVTPGPRIPATDLISQRVVGKVGACLVVQAERASATFKQSRFFDFKLSGIGSRAPSDAVTVKRILQEHGDNADPFLRAFVEEIDLLSKLEHPKVVAFLGVSWTSLRDVALVQEYLSNGSLSGLLASDKRRESSGKPRQLEWFASRESKVSFPPLPDKASLALDVIEGLAYLHSRDPPVLHRALCSDHVLLSHEFEAKLAHIQAPSVKTADVPNAAWVAWMAPEVLKGEPFSTKSDMYAFGVILTELATHNRPFDGVATASIVMQVATQNQRPKMDDKSCPDFIRDLAERCMSATPNERPTAAMAMPELLFRINRARAGGSGNGADGPAPAAATANPPANPKPQGKNDKAKGNWLGGPDGFFRR